MAISNYKEVECDEESTAQVTATLTKADGTAIALADIDSIVMTLVEVASGSTINSRSSQDVLNANNCTMHDTSGLFTWNIQVEDTSITNANVHIGDREHHLATIVVTYDTTNKMPFRVLLKVRNLRSVT